ncbi:ASCH domain-containing protein [Candidatus Woesearchaeota archaeon]|nr:ASCH domain-containing protein [Candidatus Woesearchaeota archaeon]
MEHVAIMKRSWKLIDKIVSGEKTIESRWYKQRRAPWGVVSVGDVVYFKESGGAVRARAVVSEVMQIPGLTPALVREVLDEYGKELGVADLDSFYNEVSDKKYCVLLRLRDAHPTYPFDIDKKGHGVMSAWISVQDVTGLRKRLKK